MSDIHLFNIGTFFSIPSRIGLSKIDHHLIFYLKGKIDFYGISSIVYNTNNNHFEVFSWSSKGPTKRVIVDSTHEFYDPIFDHMIQNRLES